MGSVIGLLKRAVKHVLASVGIVIFKRSTGIYVAEDDVPALVLRLCGSADPIVVDGGAHKGAFVDAIRALCPAAKFLCFEPDPTLASNLSERFSRDKAVRIVHAALGSECGTAVLNINQSRACNSLASVEGVTAGVLNHLLTTVERIEVDVTTLDEALRGAGETHCDIVKLDLQGHDLQALIGAEGAMNSAKVVVVEVWFAPVYTRIATYLDICQWMGNHGFEVYSLVGLHYGTTERLLWCDAIFLRADSPVLLQPITIS